MVIDCELYTFTDITEMRFKAFYSIVHDFIAIKCLLAFHGPSGMGLVRAILEDISMLIDLKNRDMQKKKKKSVGSISFMTSVQIA